jgi:DNA-binding transcriptional MerR regulator
MSEDLLTLSQIAKQAKIPRKRAEYLTQTRGIEPIGRVGITRLYSREQAEALERIVERMEEAREERRVAFSA